MPRSADRVAIGTNVERAFTDEAHEVHDENAMRFDSKPKPPHPTDNGTTIDNAATTEPHADNGAPIVRHRFQKLRPPPRRRTAHRHRPSRRTTRQTLRRQTHDPPS